MSNIIIEEMARGYKTKRVIEMKKRPRGKEKRRKIQSVEKLQKSEFICHVINVDGLNPADMEGRGE